MKLIVGLGNPGFRYRATRHNIGFMVADRLASDHRIRLKTRQYDSLMGRCRIDGEEAILAKPLTYMNLSGLAVGPLVKSEGIPLENILIVMDDIDLPFGRIRLKKTGSSGGHKGLQSIIEELGTEDLARLRLGIGRTDDVLTPFKRGERRALLELIAVSCDCVKRWLRDGVDAAMNRFNSAEQNNS